MPSCITLLNSPPGALKRFSGIGQDMMIPEELLDVVEPPEEDPPEEDEEVFKTHLARAGS